MSTLSLVISAIALFISFFAIFSWLKDKKNTALLYKECIDRIDRIDRIDDNINLTTMTNKELQREVKGYIHDRLHRHLEWTVQDLSKVFLTHSELVVGRLDSIDRTQSDAIRGSKERFDDLRTRLAVMESKLDELRKWQATNDKTA